MTIRQMLERNEKAIKEALSKPSDIPDNFILTGCAPRIEPVEVIEEKERNGKDAS